jgi:hypothetical protein
MAAGLVKDSSLENDMGFRNLSRQQAASREAQDDEKQKSRSEHAEPNFGGPQAKSMTSAQTMHLQRTIQQ